MWKTCVPAVVGTANSLQARKQWRLVCLLRNMYPWDVTLFTTGKEASWPAPGSCPGERGAGTPGPAPLLAHIAILPGLHLELRTTGSPHTYFRPRHGLNALAARAGELPDHGETNGKICTRPRHQEWDTSRHGDKLLHKYTVYCSNRRLTVCAHDLCDQLHETDLRWNAMNSVSPKRTCIPL